MDNAKRGRIFEYLICYLRRGEYLWGEAILFTCVCYLCLLTLLKWNVLSLSKRGNMLAQSFPGPYNSFDETSTVLCWVSNHLIACIHRCNQLSSKMLINKIRKTIMVNAFNGQSAQDGRFICNCFYILQYVCNTRSTQSGLSSTVDVIKDYIKWYLDTSFRPR